MSHDPLDRAQRRMDRDRRIIHATHATLWAALISAIIWKALH